MDVEFIDIDNIDVETFDANDGFTAEGEPVNECVLLWNLRKADEEDTKVLPLRGVGDKVDLVKVISVVVR